MYCLAVWLVAPAPKTSTDGAVGEGHLGHVFDEAEDFDVDLVEHFEGLAGVLQCDRRTCADDYRAGEGDGLDERDDYVAGAWREVDEEVVELAPGDLLEELADDLVEHGAAHDHGLVAGRDEADGDELDAVGGDGLHEVVGDDGGLAGGAEHGGDVGAVDVGVDEADAVAELGERDGEIDGDGGFADAAFAGADGDDVLDAGKALRALGCCCVLVRHGTSS